MARYSVFSLLGNALTGNRTWERVWRSPEPQAAYEVIIVGGGGHGLATAYYLATNHGLTRVAVPEKGLLGSGNIGRNTTTVRSNYLLPARRYVERRVGQERVRSCRSLGSTDF